jgi:uncharacterized protein YjiK
VRSVWVRALAAMATVHGLACTGTGTHANAKTEALRESAFIARVHAVAAHAGDSVVARWVLPPWLSEISGLTIGSDSQLFVHDDESARISIIDIKRGEVVKSFSLGKGAVSGDFEGITAVGDTLYLLTSKGVLFLFRQGENDAKVAFRTFNTRLGKECEFEGIVFDSSSTSIFLPCKRVLGKREQRREEGNLVVFRLPLPLGKSDDIVRLEIPLLPKETKKGGASFQASDITRDPASGHLVALASREREVLEFTVEGDLVRQAALPAVGRHHQPEGIAITSDGFLIVSDEAGRTPASLTVYRWPLASMPAPDKSAASGSIP